MSNPLVHALPSGWSASTLGQVSECILGGTPSTEMPQFWGGDIPWMASGDVHLRRVKDVPGRITALGLRCSNATLTSPPAVAVGLAGQGKTRGSVALTLCSLSTNQSVALLKANGRDLRTDYLFHNLDRRYEELRARSSGGGRGGLSKAILEAVPIELPPLHEQEKIAQILDTLDIAIHETEAIIAKLKAVKQGLLHDLLTRGIDANGELRPPQSEAPHLYKQSPLGWIPKEWDAVPLRKLVSDTYRYPSYYGISYVETGVPEVRGECVQPDGTLSHANGGYRYVSEKTASRFPRVRLNPGDLVMTVRGTIGKFALVPEWLKGAVITANLLKLSPDQKVVAPSWLMHVLLSSAFQDRLDAACSATTIKTIQVPALLDICIATPLRTEQQEIGARLSAIDERLSVELMKLEKINLDKLGLMDDLLTGRVRVTPLLKEAQHA